MQLLKNKNDKKMLAKKAKKVGAIYSNYFSKNRLKVYSVFGFIGNCLLFIASLILVFLVLAGMAYLLKKYFEKVDLNTFITATYALLGFALTLAVGVCFAIRISLGNTNEYFNQTESRLFFGVCLFKGIDNLLFGVYSFIYCVPGLIAALLGDYISAFGNGLVSIFFSLLLFFRFVIYSRKNKYERFSYYLTHSRYYSDISKKDKILDFMTVYDFVDHKGKLNKKKVEKHVAKRSYYILEYISELNTKIERDENIVVEQNILEDFYGAFSKRIETPIQLLSLLIGVQEYLDYLSKAKDGLRKDINKTKDNLIFVLDNVLQSKITSFSDLDLKIDDLPVFSTFAESLFKPLYNKNGKLLITQGIIISLYEQLLDVIENNGVFGRVGKIDLSKEKTTIEKYDKKKKQNLDSIKSFAKKEEAATKEVLNKLELLVNDLLKEKKKA